MTWGGTLMFSVVEITGEVTEVLASHRQQSTGAMILIVGCNCTWQNNFASSTALLSLMIQLMLPDFLRAQNGLRSP